jgi:hypothetical protein
MASTYLSKTFSSAGDRKTWTWSGWIKRSKLSSANALFRWNTSDSERATFQINSSDKLLIQFISGGSFQYNSGATTRVFRDSSAWYHIVLAVDTTDATQADRVKLYVNGEQITLSPSTNISQNTDTNVNTGLCQIGADRDTGSPYNYFDGSMAHVHFIDGTAYDADDFGETESNSGIWKPKVSPSVTYGTNGFFLKFQDSSSLGDDSSGNTNDFTLNGSGRQVLDTPSNVFATFNPLAYENAGGDTLSNGNTRMDGGSASANNMSIGTLAFSKGKWYAEFDCDAYGGVNPTVGIVSYNDNNAFGNYVGQLSKGYGYTGAGAIYNNNSQVTDTGTSYTSGDIIGVAVDCDNNKIYWYKNGTLVNSGGTTIASDEVYTFGVSQYSNTGHWLANFGNGYFGTTAVSSAENDDAGYGKFEYDVPAGYYALCTKNINTYG